MKKTLLFLIAFLGCTSLFAQTQMERLSRHVYTLASDSLGGREAGTENADRAAAYIVGQYEEIGIQPFFEDGWFQHFEQFGTSTYKNIVGIIPGNDPVLKDEFIIIGAHYDHLGTKGGTVYNGADDNASGTATVIEMARLLKSQQSSLKRSILIVAFDAEEKGLWGSSYLSSHMDLSKVRLMMSIDMVGWLEKGKSLKLNGAATINNGKRLLREEAEKYNLTIDANNFETSIMGATDTQPFAIKGVATLYVTTGLKSPYHQPGDDAELIDYQGMDRITDYLADVTLRLANEDGFEPSGRISPLHGGRKSVFSIGPSVSLVNAHIAFPNAGFNGKTQYGFNAGLLAQIRLSSHYSIETGALYEYLRAQYPDENHMYEAFLPYRQQSVVVPLNLLIGGGAMGMEATFGIGGYYGYVLNAGIEGLPDLQVDPNQWGWNWSINFKLGKVTLSGTRRYQLNPLFSGANGPQAKIRTGSFTIGYLF